MATTNPDPSPDTPARLALQRRIQRDFTYHAPHGDQADRYTEIRGTGGDFATMLVELCPPSRELSLALTAIEEAVMWANAAIARNEAI